MLSEHRAVIRCASSAIARRIKFWPLQSTLLARSTNVYPNILSTAGSLGRSRSRLRISRIASAVRLPRSSNNAFATRSVESSGYSASPTANNLIPRLTASTSAKQRGSKAIKNFDRVLLMRAGKFLQDRQSRQPVCWRGRLLNAIARDCAVTASSLVVMRVYNSIASPVASRCSSICAR